METYFDKQGSVEMIWKFMKKLYKEIEYKGK